MKFFGLIYKLALLFIGLILLIVITYYHLTRTEKKSLTNPDARVHTILLTEKEYLPDELVILQGDAVVFE
jgi:hypothetical protein